MEASEVFRGDVGVTGTGEECCGSLEGGLEISLSPQIWL